MVKSLKDNENETLLLSDERRAKPQSKGEKLAHGTGVINGVTDSLNLSTFFSKFLITNPSVFATFEHVGPFILSPIFILTGLVSAILSWRDALVNRKKGQEDGTNKGNIKKGRLLNALVNTVAWAGIATVIIGGFVASSLFAAFTPIVFAAILGVKSIFHFGMSAYYLGKSIGLKDQSTDTHEERLAKKEKRTEFRGKALGNFVGGAGLLLATGAVIGTLIFGIKPLAVLGVAAGAVFTAFIAYSSVKAYRAKAAKEAQGQKTTNEEDLLIEKPEPSNRQKHLNLPKLINTLNPSGSKPSNTTQAVVTASIEQPNPTVNPSTLFGVSRPMDVPPPKPIQTTTPQASPRHF